MAFKLACKQRMYDKRKHYLNSIKVLNGCKDCGIKDPELLSFDHVRGEKLFDICSRWDVSLEKVKLEIEKCEVVCHNCHAKRTINRLKEKETGFPTFIPFPKIPRLSREICVTEKIDGSNAVIWIDGDLDVWAGSKNRWLTPENDNYGFAKWVLQNENEFKNLGPGVLSGEWMGSEIQRGYGLTKGEKRFYLFNTAKWVENTTAPLQDDKQEYCPSCCHVVPVLYQGIFSEEMIGNALMTLKENGSVAMPGYMKPEGIVIYHTAARQYFKKTIENDKKGKTE